MASRRRIEPHGLVSFAPLRNFDFATPKRLNHRDHRQWQANRRVVIVLTFQEGVMKLLFCVLL